MKKSVNFKYHFVYQVDAPDGKFYIGRHSTNNLDDGYLGSGIRITRSVAKYGAEAHTRTILLMCSSRDEAIKEEARIVNEDLLQQSDCLNLAKGGSGGGRKGLVPTVADDGSVVMVEQEEFYKNRSRYKATNEGLTPAVNVDTGYGCLIPKGTLDGTTFKHPSTGRVTVRVETGYRSVTAEEFKAKGYRGVNHEAVAGYNNPKAKHILIFDADDVQRFECLGDFKKVCRENDLPHPALRSSYAKGGERIYQHKRSLADAKRNGTERFIGWYAVEKKDSDRLKRERALDRLVRISEELGLYD